MKRYLEIVGVFFCGCILPVSAALRLDSPYGAGVDNIVDYAAEEGWYAITQALTDRAFEAYENDEKTAVN